MEPLTTGYGVSSTSSTTSSSEYSSDTVSASENSVTWTSEWSSSHPTKASTPKSKNSQLPSRPIILYFKPKKQAYTRKNYTRQTRRIPRGARERLQSKLYILPRKSHFHELHHNRQSRRWRLPALLRPGKMDVLYRDWGGGLTGAAVFTAWTGRVCRFHSQALTEGQGSSLGKQGRLGEGPSTI